jgi:glutathione S-transferase
METPRFKLYHFPGSRSARVKWMLHEVLDDDFEVQVVQLFQGEHFSDDYRSINPNRNVPALEITMPDGTVKHLLESGAMVTFLADAYSEKGLAPAPHPFSFERADYLQMIFFGASWVDMMLWQIRLHETLLKESDRDELTSQRYRKRFAREVEPQLRERLEKHAFICGDAFTAADCIAGHNVKWARGYGLCEDDVFRGYLSRVSKRPAFVKAFADTR